MVVRGVAGFSVLGFEATGFFGVFWAAFNVADFAAVAVEAEEEENLAAAAAEEEDDAGEANNALKPLKTLDITMEKDCCVEACCGVNGGIPFEKTEGWGGLTETWDSEEARVFYILTMHFPFENYGRWKIIKLNINILPH